MAKGRHRKKESRVSGGKGILKIVALVVIVLLIFGAIYVKILHDKISLLGQEGNSITANTSETGDSKDQPSENGEEKNTDTETTADQKDGDENEENSNDQNSENQGSDENITNIDGNPALVTGLTEEQKDPNAPEKGDNHTLKGIPEVIDYRLYDDKNLLMLVNKQHAVVKDYRPSDLVTIDSSYGTWENMLIKSEAYEAFKKMNEDAVAKGYNLKICSAYRSYATQVDLFNNSVNNRGWETTFLRSAYPGRSEHHTGYAIDITSASMGWGLTQDFANYEDGKWLNTHCQDYGFIVRYPKDKTDITGYAYEPWHFRYVGVENAKKIMNQGLTLEEYLS